MIPTSRRYRLSVTLPFMAFLAVSSPSARASQASFEDRLEALEKRISQMDETERRQQILTEEVRSLREDLTLPAEPELKSVYGLAPAASKVYSKERGLSIGGYGQAWYTAFVDDSAGSRDSFDFKRYVLYAGYKFSDSIVFNSELEWEHASTSNNPNPANGNARNGNVSVEFAQLDFLIKPKFNVRAGMLLVPVGFINEIHEPLFYHGNERPEIERQIIPTTWRENGIGIFGTLRDGWDYRAYLVTSLRGTRFSSSNLRSGRQKGNRSLAEDFSFAFRTDYDINDKLTVGGSVYTGDQGNSETVVIDAAGTTAQPDIDTTIWEGHARYRKSGFSLKALVTKADIGDAAVLSQARAVAGQGPVASEMSGFYVEAAYDIMPHLRDDSDQKLEVFARREEYDTQDEVPAGFARDARQDRATNVFGLDYKPHHNVVVKLDYRDRTAAAGTPADEMNLGVGWVF